MNNAPIGKPSKNTQTFAGQVGAKAARKVKARRRSSPGVWSGLGMMGMIGWSVAIPMLLGAALGLWLDSRHAGKHAWTLALLMAGLVIGCWNAWRWVAREEQTMREEQEENDE
jgi:ATP synthase protein I